MVQNAFALTSRPVARRDEVDRLQRRIADLRGDIGSDVYELESRLRNALDVRRQVSKHPFVAAAIVVGGVLVATRIVQKLLRGFKVSKRRLDRIPSIEEESR